MPAGAMREGRQSARVHVAGQEKGSRRATARREERGTEGRACINKGTSPPNTPHNIWLPVVRPVLKIVIGYYSI